MSRGVPRWVWDIARSTKPVAIPRVNCRQCSPLTAHHALNNGYVSRKTFSTTGVSHKKAGKVNRSHAATDSSPPVATAVSATAVDEVFDFSTLESNILKALEKLTHDLSQLRAGGRFNPQTLENLRVHLNKGSKDTVRVGDLAQIVPRGRTVSVIVGEQDHVKAVSSAILSSPHSLVPQGPGPDAPTTLTITVPPPTGESRAAAVATANKTAEEALARIRNARQAHQKKLRKMELEKKVRPDDLQKAHKQMEEVVKKGNEEVKRIVDGARRVLESG